MPAGGIEPFSVPVRGGTDGSRLTELGVPTPNMFTGMQEIHGPLEWISLQDMAAATEVCIKLAQLWAAEPGRAARATAARPAAGRAGRGLDRLRRRDAP